jgi:hypothetical protein
MVATIQDSTFTHPPEWNERFVELLPRILRVVRFALRRLPRQLLEERTADCVAFAFAAFVALMRANKEQAVFPSTLARFAILHAAGGRKLGTSMNSRDVMSYRTGHRHGFSVLSLSQKRLNLAWEEALVEDRHGRCTPAQIAICRLDFKSWLSRLDAKKRAVAKCLAAGDGTSATAKRFRLTSARVSQIRQELKDSWEIFQAEQPKAIAG